MRASNAVNKSCRIRFPLKLDVIHPHLSCAAKNANMNAKARDVFRNGYSGHNVKSVEGPVLRSS